jgi:hypothetical protein
MDDLHASQRPGRPSWPAKIFGVRSKVVVRQLVKTVTFRDGHEVYFVAASGQIRTAANT